MTPVAAAKILKNARTNAKPSIKEAAAILDAATVVRAERPLTMEERFTVRGATWAWSFAASDAARRGDKVAFRALDKKDRDMQKRARALCNWPHPNPTTPTKGPKP